MKKKKLKEFVILSLIFILIIACIILLILIIRDKYYLSQESIIYISESPNPDYFQWSAGRTAKLHYFTGKCSCSVQY